MKTMMRYGWVLAALLSFGAAALAQDFPSEPYDFLSAKLAAEEGRYDEALDKINAVIAKNPKDPVLLYERAMMLIDAGRIDRAEQELRTIATNTPDFYDAQRILGRLLLDRAGGDRARVDEALKHLQAAYKLNPDDLMAGLAVAQIFMSTDRLAEAERVLAAMVERMPDQRSLNYSYAQVLTKLGRGAEAKPYLERTITADPNYGPAIMQLIEIYQQENEWHKAAELLQPLIDEDPLNADLQRQQGFFYLRAGDARKAADRFKVLVGADPKDSRARYFLAEALNDLEEYADAEKLYRQQLVENPDDPELLSSFGLSLVGQKKWDEASATFNQLLTHSDLSEPLTALARTQLANIDLQKGNYDKAIENARSIFIFRDKPNTQAINIALEAMKKQNRKPEDALALLQPLVAKFGTDPFVNARYIEALIRAGKKDEAAKNAAQQSKLGTRNVITTAEAYVAAGDSASAVALMKSAAAAKPDEIDLQFELGSVQDRSGDRAGAEKTFLSVLAKNENHAPTLNYLGYMWAENGVHLEEAHEMLTRAVGQEPDNGAYIDSLGWVYFRLGKLDLAEEYLTDATRLLPNDPTVHEHLGDVLAKRGNTAKALESYKTALNLEPEAKEVDSLRSKIAEIERKSSHATER